VGEGEVRIKFAEAAVALKEGQTLTVTAGA
jgi:hypothetical protein